MNLPAKRVENHTGDQKYWSYSVDNNNKDTLKHGSMIGTGHNDTHIPIWRGQAQNFDLLGRRDLGRIRGKILKLSAL